MTDLILKNVNKIYPNGVQAVFDFNLEIKHGEFIVLVGPSGCGKSTTLRMIAGLEDISTGQLLLGDKDISNVAPKDRDVAMVFQNYALYSHMTVYHNMGFSLTLRKVNTNTIHERVMWAADILGLTPYLNRKPKDLSGGQRQRVALGRAIVRDPKIFLLDEPLSNLDAKLRASMRQELKKLHNRLGTTMVYVTHDQIEALTLADRIVIMDKGHIKQVGTPLELYKDPKNLFVANFMGTPPMNVFKAYLDEKGIISIENFHKDISSHKLFQTLKNKNYINKKIYVGIRPENILIDKNNIYQNQSNVDLFELLGSDSLTHFKIGNQSVISKAYLKEYLIAGDKIYYDFDTNNIFFFDIETEERIYE